MNYLHPFEALLQNSEKQPNEMGFHFPAYDKKWTWKEVREEVEAIALWLRAQGLGAGDRVAILSKNRPEWVMLDLACLGCGIISVPLYPQTLESEAHYILKEAEVSLLVSDRRFPLPSSTRFVEMDSLLEKASEFKNKRFEPEFTAPDELMTLIYTSGTTGEPKGVMHSARNVFLAVEEAAKKFHVNSEDRMLSYLPLSHVVERMISEFIVVYRGAEVSFVDHIEKVGKFLPLIQPTIFAAVPRIWDILLLKVEREIDQKPITKFILDKLPFQLGRKILAPLIRRKLGFSKAKYLLSGAAALPAKTALRLDRLGLRITEGYGLSETLAISSFNTPGQEVFGSVGQAYENVQIKICEDGEIALKADYHFQGYYKKPDETAEVLRDSWFYSGDVGYIDSKGNLFLTDRKKNIFKTSNGKYVAPCPIENKLRAHPMVQEVMVIGENQPHCIALISVHEDRFQEKLLLDHLQRVNKELAMHERIHSLGVSLFPWSIEAGELTPTMKLKRKQLLIRYETQIDQLYKSRAKLEIFDRASTERTQLANSRF